VLKSAGVQIVLRCWCWGDEVLNRAVLR